MHAGVKAFQVTHANSFSVILIPDYFFVFSSSADRLTQTGLDAIAAHVDD